MHRSVFRFVTIHAFVRQTDRQITDTIAIPLWHFMQRGKKHVLLAAEA